MKRFSDRRTIGIVIFAYSSFPFEAMLRLFLRLSSQGYHLALTPVINHPTNRFSEFGMCNRLYQAMKARDPRASVESLPLLMELDVTYSIIQSIDMLISYKLHPSLAALRAGKPVFAFSMMNKVRSLLRQCGMEEYVCSYQEPEEVYWPRNRGLPRIWPDQGAGGAAPHSPVRTRERSPASPAEDGYRAAMPAASPVLMAV
ncbi:hypothetical protein [Paenibacillus thiaminolyticus]|uniref:Polysaccharide pyruvyl transferase domain-containing protein n=1 Tax=Paenibacillus thiaminolyticus TaxID=49283 RepID=A0A3A3GG77_PANTH|nr:hypothetical protein [Paenibacillus thiaminolyticus]RJG23162.1 hypothetical protein DQX05_14955 [Paenibacillus thiaminolyticus]